MKILNINFNTNSYTKNPPVFARNDNRQNVAQDKTFNYFNAIKNYNVAFLGSKQEKEEPIYAIDAYGNFKKFQNSFEASVAFGVAQGSVLRCAKGDSDCVGDFVFAYADCVEERDRSGKKVPDTLIINLAAEVLSSMKATPLAIDDALELKVKSKAKEVSKKQEMRQKGERIDASVYAIDKDGRYLKYEKVQELIGALDISKGSVYKCLRKEKDNINGIIFCYDFEVEAPNEEGINVPNSRLIKKQIRGLKKSGASTTLDMLLLRKQQSDKKEPTPPITNAVEGVFFETQAEDLSSIQLRYLQKPFYAMDDKGHYRKFYLQKYAADALGLFKDKISDCLQKRLKSTKGYSFVYASEVESADKKGNTILDTDRLTGKTKGQTGFYIIDKDGNYQRFETATEAHETLKISYDKILGCIFGRQDTTSNYTFIKARDFEIENEDGTISIDEEKLQEARELLNKTAVYLIDENGKYQRFESRIEAGNSIGVSGQDISAAALGRKKKVHGYVAINANEVEKVSKDGEIEVLVDKINEALEAANKIRTVDVSGGFYAIDKDCKYQKFFSIQDAESKLDIQYTRILNCLLGVDKMAKGYVFAMSEDVEIEDENNTSVDMEKIKEKASYFENKAVYAISKDGKYTRYKSQKEASDVLNIPLVNISRCANGTIKETYGYSFLFAREVEMSNEDNETILDEDLIQEKVNWLNRDVVYVIDKDGNYERFETRKLAEEKTSVKKASIRDCLNGKHKTSGGYVFAFPYEVETKQEDGSYIVDKDKIKEKMKLFIVNY